MAEPPDERLAGLSPAKRKLYEQRLRALQASASGPARAEPATQPDHPLSYAQERFWLLEQLEPGNPAHHISGITNLTGELDVGALEAALAGICARHEVLRTRFMARAGTPRQFVAPFASPRLELHDLEAFEPGERDRHRQALVDRVLQQSFDLERDAPWRCVLLRLSAREHELVTCFHHIAADGLSIAVILAELAERYRARAEGREPRLPELPWQVRDHAHWQRTEMAGGRMQADLDWWRAKLYGLPELALPADRPRSREWRARGAPAVLHVERELCDELRRIALAEGATLHMALLALFESWLARICGQDEVVVGIPVAGRSRSELAHLVGFFVNSLVLRGNHSGEPSLREAIRRARSASLEAQAHADLPFERLVEALAPDRHLDRNPLFQVMFNLIDFVPLRAELPGLTLEASPLPSGTQLDLALDVWVRDGELRFELELDPGLFEPHSGQRFLVQIETLLRAALREPDRALARLPLVSDAERELLSRTWADAPPARGADTPFLARFERQARERPAATAVVEAGHAWSYADLERRVEELSCVLAAAGAGPGERVVVCLPRCLERVALPLALWRLGAVYVPLDPAWPLERRARIAEDARARLVVDAPLATAADARVATAASPTPEDPACLFYTSGTTGEPKGVSIPHRALENHVAWALEAFELGPRDRFLHWTSPGFDASLWELLPPLAAGASIHLLSDGVERDPAAFAAEVARSGTSVLQLVPVLLEALSAEPVFARWRSVRALICGGEALSGELVQRFRERCCAADLVPTLWNLYGPTECCIDATAERVGESEACERSIAIGRPIAGARALVLDARGELVPVGLPGELCLGGAGLALGYWNRPAEEARHFVADPLRPGKRLYRSGDRARWLEDGRLEFQGRLDGQLKLRGQRVEPGEIESILRAHPAVRAAAVGLREVRGGGSLLCAWVEPRSGPLPSESALRAWLAARLPEAWLPARMIAVGRWPLTSNGKLDRRALELPAEPSQQAAADDPLAALAALELARVLGLECAGPDEDFFALGGHSLLAAQLAARLGAALGRAVPLREVFAAPTPRALARRLRALRGAEVEAPIVPLPVGAPPVLSSGAERLWLLQELEPHSPAYNMAGALHLRGRLDEAALEQALRELVRRHEALHTLYPSRAGRPEPAVQPSAEIRIERVDASATGEGRALERALEAAHALAARPFELRRELPLRARLVRLAQDDHLLCICLHHIAADGASLGVLERELAELYAAARAGREPRLAEPALQLSDWAAWQRARAASPAQVGLLEWWRAELADAAHVLELPADRARRPGRERPAARLRLELRGEELAALRRAARAGGATLHMALLASFAATLARWSGQEDLLIGAALAGRSRPELEGLVAFVVNLLPVRCRLDGRPGFAELLRRTRESVLRALEHEELSFERLVEALAPARDPTRPPLMQVSFAWRERAAGALALEGLQVEPIEVDPIAAKLELVLEVEERSDALACTFEYDASLWDESTIVTFASAWRCWLAAALAEPLRPWDELPLLSTEERAGEIAAGEGQQAANEPPECFVPRFERHARARPERVALIDGERRLTYAELDGLAERWALALCAAGLAREEPAGLLLPRSLDSVAALVAVWKAGACALPLEPAQPAERTAWMLADAGARLVLHAGSEAPSGLPPGCRALSLAELERAGQSGETAPLARAAPEPDARTLAYILYTSGSTGRPKGVEIEHGSLARQMEWMQAALQLGPEDCFLHRLAPVFDGALLENANALACGACIVAAPAADEADPAALSELIERERVSLLVTLPAFFGAFLDEARALARCRSVRNWICGAEALPAELARRFLDEGRALGLGATLWNLYGPTEATINALAERVDAGELEGSVPIGRPLPFARAHLLDARGEPVPRGWPAELWLGGPGLARGYRARPEETRAAFVPDPLRPSVPGERLYRSGDIVRRLADGRIVFLGRRDGQVKLRGRRIELGEIEGVLAAHPAVLEAVALLQQAGRAEPRLVAHVVTHPGVALEPAALRQHAAARLPAVMVPARIAVNAALPRLASGKVDRGALAGWSWPEDGADGTRDSGAAPANEREAGIARVFAEVLALGAVSRDDDFFALGGSSLSALRALPPLRAALGVELPLRALFDRPTPRGLALALESSGGFAPERRAQALHLPSLALLDDAIRPASPAQPRVPRPDHVLVTGATGFLGAFLLDELARCTSAVLHCLVRAPDEELGLRRLRANLERYGLWRADLTGRLRAVPGDLASPGLGLSNAEHSRLEREIELVYHSGARVHFLARYEALAAENVESVRALLAIACAGRPKPFHFVSTLGIVAARDLGPADEAREDDPLERFARLDEGYEQTKWVAEKLVRTAGERGLPVAIYRPGRIVAHSRTGACNPDDAASAFIRGCVRLGCAPEIAGEIDLTPVDYVASAIARLSLERGALGETWHLLNPRPSPLSAAIDVMRARGHAVRSLPIAEWREALRAQALGDEQHPLRALLPLLLGDQPGTSAEASLLPDVGFPRIRSEKTQAALCDLGIECPAADLGYLGRWLARLSL